MKLLCSTAILFVLATIACGVRGDRYDRTAIYQGLGLYGNMVNALAKYSPARCGDPMADPAGLASAIDVFVETNFASNVQYFRTSAGLNFSVGGTYNLVQPALQLHTSQDLKNALKQFYSLIFTYVFTSSNHWMYSTPYVSFTERDSAFGHQPTATIVVENENLAFTCDPVQGEIRQVYGDTFIHKFCPDGNDDNAVWKICGFYEDNKIIYTQSDSLFAHLAPVGSAPSKKK